MTVPPLSLLSEVQRDLLDGKPLADLLRKCMILGSQSGSTDLRLWATNELKGYQDLDSLPAYRKIPAGIYLDGVSGNSAIRGQPITPRQLPDYVQEHISGEAPVFAGVGQLEALYDSTKQSGRNPQLPLPGWELIGGAIDRASGNPFQHTLLIYWQISAAAIAGVLDDIRTALTEVLAELGDLMPREQEAPTPEQVSSALHLAISGGSTNVNIAAPSTSVTAANGSVIQGFSGGPTAAAGDEVTQTTTYTSNATNNAAVRTWVDEYEAALEHFNPSTRTVVETQLAQVRRELENPKPDEIVVNTLLGSLRTFAENVIASAGAGAGTIGLTELIAHWPFH